MMNLARNGTPNDFRLNKLEGDTAMLKVNKWLEANGVACQPYNIEADKQGVDIACSWGTVDVKADKTVFKSNNLTFETFSNVLTQKPGWGYHDTDYIIWIDDNPLSKDRFSQPNMYIARLADVRLYYEEHKAGLRHIKNVPLRKDNIVIQQSEYALIPITEYRQQYPLLWVLPGGTIANIGKGQLPKPYDRKLH